MTSTTTVRTPRRSLRIPAWVAVFVGTFLVQFLVLNMIAETRHFLPDSDDMRFYNAWAHRILGGQFTDGKAFYGLPGYAYALAAIYKITGGYQHEFSPYLVAQVQAVFHALTATWLFLLGRIVFGAEPGFRRRGTSMGLLAAAAWALFTPAQIFSAILMPTAWVVCAFWGLTYWLVRIQAQGDANWWRPWLWMGLLAGGVAMLVATILMLLPMVVVAIALTVHRGAALRSRILPVVGAVAVLMAGVYTGCSPVWIHNYFIAKDRVLLSAHDGLNFYLGNHANSNGYTAIPRGLRASQDGLLKDSLAIPEKELGRPLKRSEASAYWKEKGKVYIRDNPLAWMRLIFRKFENFWNAFQYDDLSILKLVRDENGAPPGLRFGFAAALGLPGLLVCWARWPRSRWVAGAVLLHMAALMPVFITERYRLTAAPGLLLLGIAGLWALWENLSSRAWLKVVPHAALIVAAAWFVSKPQADIGLWSLDFYKAGIRATDGRLTVTDDPAVADAYLARARRNLETAYAYVPDNPEITFALGNVWYYAHDNERAKMCFERALQASLSAGRPHEGALNNLGTISLVEKRPKAAEGYFLKSLAVDPAAAKTWSLLAEAFRDQGEVEKARDAIGRAITLKPSDAKYASFLDGLGSPSPAPAPR